MGLNNGAAIILSSVLENRGEFSEVLTIGRQEYLVNYFMSSLIKKKYGISKDLFADPAQEFLRKLGAVKIDSLDINDYQGATIIQDLNLPIDSSFHNKYDLVLEFGTIEHVANISQAMQNLMLLVKPGGLLIFVSPGNNFFGHGCYQISPEFFLTQLTSANGYRIESLLLHINGLLHGSWWKVDTSPGRKQRFSLKSKKLVFVVCVARKVGSAKPQYEQQADYLELWNRNQKLSSLGVIYGKIPDIMQQMLTIWPIPQLERYRAKKLLTRIRAKEGSLEFSIARKP